MPIGLFFSVNIIIKATFLNAIINAIIQALAIRKGGKEQGGKERRYPPASTEYGVQYVP